MIDLATLQMQIQMNENKKILNEHQNRIWQDKEGNGTLMYLPKRKAGG